MEVEFLNVDVNLVAVVLALVASMIVGFVWYSRSVLGNTWASLAGLSMEEMNSKEGMGMRFGSMMLANVVAAIFLAVLIPYVGFFNSLSEVSAGLLAGLFAFVFAGASMVSHYMFAHRPEKLLLIDAGNQLVTYLVMGLVIAVVS